MKVILDIGGFRKVVDVREPGPSIEVAVMKPLDFACYEGAPLHPDDIGAVTVRLYAHHEEKGIKVYMPQK